jgi:hypothetical protein
MDTAVRPAPPTTAADTAPVIATVPDTDPSVPLGPGDPRPGRLPDRPAALVIDPEASTRSRLAADLAADGYQVWTCPGPCTVTRCPARGRELGARCPRLPDDVALIVVDQASARTRLLHAYALWAPTARVEVTGTLACQAASE